MILIGMLTAFFYYATGLTFWVSLGAAIGAYFVSALLALIVIALRNR